MITFLKFQAENLFSFDAVNLELSDRGLVLVSGWSHDENTANGSGKSSITSKGIIWTLYGKTPGGLKGDEVIKTGKESCSGTLYFIGRDKKHYRIHRQRKP